MADGRRQMSKGKWQKKKRLIILYEERDSGTSQLPGDADHTGHVSNVPCPLVMLEAE